MTQIINTTPHAINLIAKHDGYFTNIKTYEKSEISVRLKVSTVFVEMLDDVSLTKTVFGEPVGLPEYQEGVYYIVSQLVKTALPDRKDLLVPAEMQRDEVTGQPIGCLSFGI